MWAQSDQGGLELFCATFFVEKKMENKHNHGVLKKFYNYSQMPAQGRHDSNPYGGSQAAQKL